MATEQDQEFVNYVVKALVDNPDKVETTRTIDERGVLLELKVDPSDMGKVIGKEGKTAKSVRTLLRVVGAKNNAIVNLKIVEPEGGQRAAGGAERVEVQDNASASEVQDTASEVDDIKL